MFRAFGALAGFVFVTTFAAYAQVSQQPAGLDTDWDISVILGEIGAHHGRLLPALKKIDAQAWVAKGASDAYAAQLESAEQQTAAVENAAKDLAANPERLAAGLELFFRIEGIETMLATLEDGMRKYQSPADAAVLASQAAEDGLNRDRLRQYLVTLAGDRERELQMLDREAQRCRAALAAAPGPAPPPANPVRKK